MPFGLWAGPKNSRVKWCTDPPWEGVIFGERGAHCKVCGLSAMSCAKMAEPIIRCGLDPDVKGQVLGERTCLSYPRTVCSNHLSCRISNLDSSQYSISMQPIKRYSITDKMWRMCLSSRWPSRMECSTGGRACCF